MTRARSIATFVPGSESMFCDQSLFDIRCEWGLAGILSVGKSAYVTVIVDVLSFSTCVDVATSRGAMVFPYRWNDASAKACAERLGAELAGPRGEIGRYSLSPVSMTGITESEKIVLPSANGSQLTIEAESLGQVVIAGCFRNCRAVARYAASRGRPVAVIACGERWSDGLLRPAVEDYVAAGAIIAELPGTSSPEALAAVGAWNAARSDLEQFLLSCASGRELAERGFEKDVQMAAELNISAAVPVLHEHAFVEKKSAWAFKDRHSDDGRLQ